MDGQWRTAKHIWVTFTNENGRSNATLFIQEESEGVYKITSIRANNEGHGLELDLLQRISQSATENGITLLYELDLNGDSENVDLMKEILTKSMFRITIEDDESQLWQR
jgi:hypothetical protein